MHCVYLIFVMSFYSHIPGSPTGDLKGLTKVLDQVQWLGVDAVWLMPIAPSPSDHKYDVTNYCSIDKQYGSMSDFDAFVKACHSRGIKVILDFTANHTSALHPWFMDSAANPRGPYAEYYSWRESPPEGATSEVLSKWHKHENGRYYYGYFWSGMPDLNYDSRSVRDEIRKAATFWIDHGVDGFRLDAARHIYNPGEGACVGQAAAQRRNIAWWSEFKSFCKSKKPDIMLIAEVWDTSEVRMAYATAFDSLFHFGLGGGADAQVLALTSGKLDPNVWTESMQGYYNALQARTHGFFDMPFISNHDMDRPASILDQTDQLKLAASIYLTLPGIPQMYYGEELGMKGRRSPSEETDNSRRTPMLWGEGFPGQTRWVPSPDNSHTRTFSEQKKDPDSLLNHYRQLILLRKSYESLEVGSFEAVNTNRPNLLAYVRRTPRETVLVLHCLGPGPTSTEACEVSGKIIFKSGCYRDRGRSPYGTLVIIKRAYKSNRGEG